MILSAAIRVLCCFLAFLSAYRCTLLFTKHVQMMPRRKQQLKLDDILRDRTLCLLLFSAAGLVVSYATSMLLFPILFIIAFLLSKRAPSMLDAREAKELRSSCDEYIDVMADIVAMGVRAGLSFDAALDMYCDKFENPLAREMKNARMQWASGIASRKQALEDLSGRIGSRALRRFSETSLQAIHYGAPLAGALSNFSRDVRQQRRSAIERQIEKAPIKLLIPTGVCILPAMLILVMGPVLLQFIGQGF